MVSDLPHALVDVLSAMERDRLGYVLYRDPKADRRVVILVEGPSDATVIEAALGTAGAEQTAEDAAMSSSSVRPTQTGRRRRTWCNSSSRLRRRTSPISCGWPPRTKVRQRLVRSYGGARSRRLRRSRGG